MFGVQREGNVGNIACSFRLVLAVRVYVISEIPLDLRSRIEDLGFMSGKLDKVE